MFTATASNSRKFAHKTPPPLHTIGSSSKEDNEPGRDEISQNNKEINRLVQRARQDPSSLYPDQILQMQQILGNQNVLRLLNKPTSQAGSFGTGVGLKTAASVKGAGRTTVQRVLPDAKTYKKLDTSDAELVAIGNAVDAYNKVAGNRSDPAGFQMCFVKLQAVERSIYHWFNLVSQNTQQFSMNEHTDTVKDLLAQAEKEHEVLVETSKNLKTVLPFDDSILSPKEKTEMQTLWQEIVNSEGKIKVLGSDTYTKRVRSELAKILSTPTGRGMLQFLNTPKTGEVKDSKEALINNVYIGEKVSDLPQEVRDVSPELDDPGRAEAQPLNFDDTDKSRNIEALSDVIESDLLDTDDLAEFPNVDAGNLSTVRTSAWGGKKGFSHKSKKFSFNTKGTGAFVTSFADKSIHPGKGPGNQILSPSWVTTGHELGHAANMKAGSSTIKTTGALMTSLAGGGKDSDNWDNTEELLNIENVENALRSESGQSERLGHRPPEWLLAQSTQIKKVLRRPLYKLHEYDQTWYTDPEWSDLEKRIGKTPSKKIVEQGVQDGYKLEVDNFLTNKVNALLGGYLTSISSEQVKANDLMSSLTTAKEKEDTMLFLHKNIAKFNVIKKKLHHGFFKRIGNKQATRKQARVTTLQNIVSGAVAI